MECADLSALWVLAAEPESQSGNKLSHFRNSSQRPMECCDLSQLWTLPEPQTGETTISHCPQTGVDGDLKGWPPFPEHLDFAYKVYCTELAYASPASAFSISISPLMREPTVNPSRPSDSVRPAAQLPMVWGWVTMPTWSSSVELTEASHNGSHPLPRRFTQGVIDDHATRNHRRRPRVSDCWRSGAGRATAYSRRVRGRLRGGHPRGASAAAGQSRNRLDPEPPVPLFRTGRQVPGAAVLPLRPARL